MKRALLFLVEIICVSSVLPCCFRLADITCDPGYVKCPRKSKCIRSSFVCDGDNDCGDLTDEPNDCREFNLSFCWPFISGVMRERSPRKRYKIAR